MAAIGYIDNVGINAGADYIGYGSAIVVSFYPAVPVITEASTQSLSLPSVGILVLDHFTSSGLATAGLVGVITPSRLSSRISPTTNFMFAIWRILTWLWGKVNRG